MRKSSTPAWYVQSVPPLISTAALPQKLHVPLKPDPANKESGVSVLPFHESGIPSSNAERERQRLGRSEQRPATRTSDIGTRSSSGSIGMYGNFRRRLCTPRDVRTQEALDVILGLLDKQRPISVLIQGESCLSTVKAVSRQLRPGICLQQPHRSRVIPRPCPAPRQRGTSPSIASDNVPNALTGAFPLPSRPITC